MDAKSLSTGDYMCMVNNSVMVNPLTVDEVFETYYKTVYRLAYSRSKTKHDADDILQEVFLRYLKSSPAFESEEHRKAWLIKATLNCGKSLFTSAWKRNTSQLDEDFADTLKSKSSVYYAVLDLPIKYRTVIHLFYYEGYSIIEIANLIKSNESTVKSQLYRARNKLSEILKGEDFDV